MPKITTSEVNPHKIRLINFQHVTLHKEAWEAIEQAEMAGWDDACVILQGGFYPHIGFYSDGGQTDLATNTVPGYMEQTIYNYADIKWNRPILSPGQVQSLKQLLDNLMPMFVPAGELLAVVADLRQRVEAL